MTLRLTDEETEALRLRAEELGKSMQTVAREAIREVADTDAELLDRLAR